MTNSATEYLPTASESLPNGAGQGSGFNDKPPKKAPYELREQVAQCNDAKLKKNSFAKLLFCTLTDLAFKNDFRRGEGIIECSKNYLADFFGRSESTIQRAERALRETGFLWTKMRWTGANEITRWFIREWADDRFEHDAHTGANFGRRLTGVQRNTVRGDGGKFAANPDSERSQFLAWQKERGPQSTVKAEMTVDHGQVCGLPTVNGAVGHTAEMTAAPPHGSGRAHGMDDRRQTARMHAGEPHERPLTDGTNDRGPTAPVTGFSTLEIDYSPKELTNRLGNRAQGAVPKGKGRKPTEDENDFMLACTRILGIGEMAKNGGGWRTFYWQEPAHAWAVINETKSAGVENRIDQTPAKFANDLRSSRRLRGPAQPKPAPAVAQKPAPVVKRPSKPLGKREKAAALAALREAVQ